MLNARFKSFEDMPAWTKCCPETIQAMTPFCGTAVQLIEGTQAKRPYNCPFCGAPYSGKVSYATSSGGQADVDVIDIDEGSDLKR